ncbi:MAG TPA: adenylosuccinate lyase family protein [Kofleriaceae bacterium]|jgi:adenylosuccinate lyase|nr:adenylosuccinate lyase family protein [Kofleriaceae bacterium]
MSATIIDSVVYGGLWASEAVAAIFEETNRTRRWLEILAVLAETQGEAELIPRRAALDVAATCRSIPVDGALLEELRAGREATGHSTAGLLRAIARRCPGTSGEWVHFGATVQDLTDTWLMLALRDARAPIAEALVVAGDALAAHAARHRASPMLGRTHGQHGLPITFGLKAAGWTAELRRHGRRLDELAARMDTGQLAGGVGSLSSLGPRALAVQAAFCQRLGLRAPVLPWTASRDVIAEWGAVLTLATGTADRVGHEVYNLARSEIGELGESLPSGVIGSITMPHKRNPEAAEHIGSLARIVRHQAACLGEGLVHDHERDGRSWKVEWHIVPEITMLAARALELLADLARGLVVHADRMLRNLEATRGFVLSEAVMLALASHVGRETAHRLVSAAADDARRTGCGLEDAVRGSAEIMARLSRDEVAAAFDLRRHAGQCAALVDRFLGVAP